MKKNWIIILSSIAILLWGVNVYADDALEQDIIGKWVNSKIVLGEDETLLGNDLDDQDIFWEFTDNGRVTRAFEDKKETGTWYMNNGAIVAEVEGEEAKEEVVLTIEEGMLKETIQDGFYYYYVKKKDVEKRNMEPVENYYETPVEDELGDVFINGEILKSGGIMLFGGLRYYFCHQNKSGFDSSVDLYGIYDYGTKTWPIEMQEMDLSISRTDIYLEYVGDGMFRYSGNKEYYFSAPLGDYFSVDFVTNDEGRYFQGGYSVGERENGNLGVLSIYGEINDTGISGANVVYKCNKGFVARECDNSGNTEDIILYYYDTNQAISLDKTYAEKITSDVVYKMTENYLYVKNIKGMDDQLYYAVFDKFGNTVTPATLMTDFDYERYRDEAGTVLYESDDSKVVMLDEFYSDAYDDTYTMEFCYENKTQQGVLITLTDSYLNERYYNVNESVLVPAGEWTYQRVNWGPEADIRDLDSKKIYSAILSWSVTDENSDKTIDEIGLEALK